MLEAFLYDQHIAQIDPRATEVAGSWAGPYREGKPVAWEEAALRFFASELQQVSKPFLVDIGANTGSYCMLPLVCPGMRCLALEPAPYSFEILKSNIQANNLESMVRAEQLAISNYHGQTTLKYPQSESGLACLGTPRRFSKWEEIEVEVRRLDDLLPELGIEAVDFLKIDTEGCEKFVLLGAEQTIKSNHPRILLEVNQQNTAQFSYDAREILQLLARWGYQGKQLDVENFYLTLNPRLRDFIETHDIHDLVKLDSLTRMNASGQRELISPELHLAVSLTEYGYRVQITDEPEVIQFLEERFPDTFTFRAREFVFDARPSEAINKARIEHLDSLGLDLNSQKVLELGAGVGKLTPFFLERNCEVVATEARSINVDEFKRRHPEVSIHQRDLNESGSHDDLGRFPIVFCYGTLYHLSRPAEVIGELAAICQRYLLLETCVHYCDNGELNLVQENKILLDQSAHGVGCRPGRDWVFAELSKYFPYVYITATQPNHPDYPAAFPSDPSQTSRAVFVASREKLALPQLSTQLFALQTS